MWSKPLQFHLSSLCYGPFKLPHVWHMKVNGKFTLWTKSLKSISTLLELALVILKWPEPCGLWRKIHYANTTLFASPLSSAVSVVVVGWNPTRATRAKYKRALWTYFRWKRLPNGTRSAAKASCLAAEVPSLGNQLCLGMLQYFLHFFPRE